MIRRPPRSTPFPTRRSSDLPCGGFVVVQRLAHTHEDDVAKVFARLEGGATQENLGHDLLGDRKSTRLNSSHSQISYAVFCLKTKKPTLSHHHHGTTNTSQLH